MICSVERLHYSREESFNRKNIHEEEVLTSHKFSSIGESELISSMMQLKGRYLRAEDACTCFLSLPCLALPCIALVK